MPAVTYADFSGGLDRRLSIDVQEANRLWVLRNAYVTLGKRIAKRPGLRAITTGLAGSVGLEAVNGRLKVFVAAEATYVPPVSVDAIKLTTPPGLTAGQFLQRIYSATMFNGFIYAVADYAPDGVYVGGATTSSSGGGNMSTIPTKPLPGQSL